MDDTKYKKDLLFELRIGRDLTQAKLAGTLGVHRETVSRAERGASCSIETLLLYATLFHKNLYEFLIQRRPVETKTASHKNLALDPQKKTKPAT